VAQIQAQSHPHTMPHQMQHGFVLSTDDHYGSHLVTTGHHSRQAEIKGQLVIGDQTETETYRKRKQINTHRKSYFLFQAQNLDLPSLKDGQVLNGHIVESEVGKYESKNIIIKKAILKVSKVILNIENPFFTEE
jgi:hypothetical protein